VTPSPCPFCGSVKITVEWEPCMQFDETDTNRRWFAECTQCSCQGPFCQKEPEVILAWNKRQQDAYLAGLKKAAEIADNEQLADMAEGNLVTQSIIVKAILAEMDRVKANA
jgi:hypothetical protein